jgi:crotonobetainyl-CoA:carnitine CoA-transferase CaiB-like acyl-CoA transferase
VSGYPLEGIRVADFGQYIAGPAVAQVLADLGAQVVKIEPIHGEAARAAGALGTAMIRANNRDKLGLALDLRRPEGHAVAVRLLEASDVLVENMRPGAMRRLGLDADRARAINPRLVYLSISAFGSDPAGTRPGLDIAAQAESGIMSITGEADRDPQRVGFTVVDNATSYAAAVAVLAALLRRESTGLGAAVDTSLFEVAVHLQGFLWTDMFDSGSEPVRTGNGYPTAAPAADVVTVRDGQIVVSAYTPAHWARLCAALERPELEGDPRFATNDARVANRTDLRAELSSALSGYLTAEAVEFLNAHGIVAGAIRSHRQVAAGEDARRLDLFPATAAGAGGRYRYAAPPYTFHGLERQASRPAPAIGEHSREILESLGYSQAEVERLIDSEVVAEPLVPAGER